MKHWPDDLIHGNIRSDKAINYDGHSLRDTEHCIPTFGSVKKVNEEFVIRIFNYPGQTEDIARRLVAAWNYCDGLDLDHLEGVVSRRADI